jgi:hypothetical protein
MSDSLGEQRTKTVSRGCDLLAAKANVLTDDQDNKLENERKTKKRCLHESDQSGSSILIVGETVNKTKSTYFSQFLSIETIIFLFQAQSLFGRK